MQITTTPSCRVGWEGQTLQYVVKAQGANDIVALENEMEGVRVQVANVQPTADGVEAVLQVEVLDSSLY